MGNTPRSRLEQVSADEQAEIRKAISGAPSHQALAWVCADLMSCYQVAYTDLRMLVPTLPEYLAGVRRSAAERPAKKPFGQSAVPDFLSRCRAAAELASCKNRSPQKAAKRVVGMYITEYEVARKHLVALMEADREEHPYQLVSPKPKQRPAERKPKAKKPRTGHCCSVCGVGFAAVIPPHRFRGKECRGVGKPGVSKGEANRRGRGSVWIVGGGLPGSSRRH